MTISFIYLTLVIIKAYDSRISIDIVGYGSDYKSESGQNKLMTVYK